MPEPPRRRLLIGDTVALGPGKAKLLDIIDKTGSISAAARKLGLSYRRAWDMVLIANNCFKGPLVKRKVGGKGGGRKNMAMAGGTKINLITEAIDLIKENLKK